MNGYHDQKLDDDAFGPKDGFSALKTFDAFPKTKASYTQRSAGGGYATVLLILVSSLLAFSEFRNWWTGSESQTFSVEKGVAHTMQINLDTVVAMKCDDLHINVQDASGDRILAAEMLQRHPTVWQLWSDPHRMKKKINDDSKARQQQIEEDRHVRHFFGEARSGGKKFPKTPKTPKGTPEDACRVFGSLEINRVQGDFHLTARGHGYMEWGREHLDHKSFNFSHVINELSFGPLYPSILNPLDNTAASSDEHFVRFQYYLSVVPTIFTRSRNPKLPPVSSDPKAQEALRHFHRGLDTIITNQYAVTSHAGVVSENSGMPGGGVPGIFFKFDIEPILLTITQTGGSLLALLMRIVNVVSGIMVGGGWLYQLYGWADENFLSRRRRRRGTEKGMLHGGKSDEE